MKTKPHEMKLSPKRLCGGIRYPLNTNVDNYGNLTKHNCWVDFDKYEFTPYFSSKFVNKQRVHKLVLV